MHKHTNRLISESSPYLLQHAHNPVNWEPWDEQALERARTENKLLLISVGYSACHWCHVMEHESFEDEQVARIMNDLFVCIKVDREERPDIDQVYMHAVQLMTGQGGWPLNCFAMPDGRPVYGGTYFQKKQWINVLMNLADLWKSEPGKVIEYAEKLTEGVKQSEQLVVPPADAVVTAALLDECIAAWKQRFDNEEGGPKRAPKFPLPNNYLFLLRQAHFTADAELRAHVELTLAKMAYGGIYDQAGGGFARYSTDMDWKVPHFEKMLYDNSQLVSLYAEAYQCTGNDLFREIVDETIAFVKRELTSPEGAFYSALDADSEGVEGKFYTWSKTELEELFGVNASALFDYFNVNKTGFWEHDQYILLRRDNDDVVAARHGLTTAELKKQVAEAKTKLMAERSKRIRPGLDDKSLTSWNAQMLRACVDAWTVFGKQEHLDMALRNADFLLQQQCRGDGGLWHSWKNGKSSINGFLEDYAFVIDAFIALYSATFDNRWLERAEQLMHYAQSYFADEASGYFYFTSALDAALIARKAELADNVIPASNSVMAVNLFYLGHLLGREAWTAQAVSLLAGMQHELKTYGGGYSNWGILQQHVVFPFYELVFVGKAVDKMRDGFRNYYLPNKIFAGSREPSDMPLFRNRYVEAKNLLYVCVNNTCALPVEDVQEAIARLR